MHRRPIRCGNCDTQYFVARPLPGLFPQHSEFDEIMDQVKRWKLDDFLTDRTYEGLAAR